jgi:hypothetical protein
VTTKNVLFAILFLPLAILTSFAAPPTAPKEIKDAKKNEPFEIVVKPDGAKDFGYRVVGGDAMFAEMKTKKTGERVFWIIPKTDSPLTIVWWTQGEIESAVTEINKAQEKKKDEKKKVEPAPPPKPKPKPDPKPDPLPINKAEKVWVFVVEDAAASRLPATAQLLNDPFWSGLKPKHDWRHYLSTHAEAISAGYVKELAGVGYPGVLILDAKDGAVLKKFKSDGTIKQIDAAVKEVAK